MRPQGTQGGCAGDSLPHSLSLPSLVCVNFSTLQSRRERRAGPPDLLTELLCHSVTTCGVIFAAHADCSEHAGAPLLLPRCLCAPGCVDAARFGPTLRRPWPSPPVPQPLRRARGDTDVCKVSPPFGAVSDQLTFQPKEMVIS